ncbi:MAG TPA: M48 family metalloprotease [Verrucomicrobiae bacterium]|nr:M48 family metalloprotease [Verrucomicrobiae bacterium]
MQNGGGSLTPLPYHVEVRDYLKAQEPDLWNWFSSAQAQADYTESLRLELLKSTYRLDPESHPDLYRDAEQVKAALQLDVPLTLYQAQHSPQPNAALYYIPGEGHLVLSGPVLSLLAADELKSVIGHELAHYHLWRRDGGDFHVADRLLEAAAHDPRASNSYIQSARWYQLYTEIFADRGSLDVTGNVHTVVSSLVKIQTGLPHVSAASYLKQAEEIFQKSRVTTAELSHPEAFIRARALALWAERADAATCQINAMIEGSPALDEVDLIGQVRLTRLTRRLLEHLLRPKWFQTDATLGHAKLFFDDFQATTKTDPVLLEELKFSDPKLREYLCYLLLDFVAADPELDELPLAASLELAKQLEIDTLFEKHASRELSLKPRDLKRVKETAAELLAGAEARP